MSLAEDESDNCDAQDIFKHRALIGVKIND
jgi:hypothetical protein